MSRYIHNLCLKCFRLSAGSYENLRLNLAPIVSSNLKSAHQIAEQIYILLTFTVKSCKRCSDIVGRRRVTLARMW